VIDLVEQCATDELLQARKLLEIDQILLELAGVDRVCVLEIDSNQV
jgi:hypothetical protein